MITQVVDSLADLDRLAPAWHRLAEISALTPFQTFQWTRAWWSLVGEFDRDLRLHVVVVSDHNRVGAIAPFMVQTRDGDSTLTFATDPWADYLDVLVDARQIEPALVAQELGEHLTSGVGSKWSAVILDEVPPWSPLTFDAHVPCAETEASPCPRLRLDDPALVAALEGGRGEHALKRRRLERLGRLSFRLHAEPAGIAERMPAFIAMHLRQWMRRSDRGLTFDDPAMVRFYLGMVERHAAAGLLALAELALDDRPLALHLGFTHRDTFWGYRTTYEVDAGRFSPGHLLHRSLVGELARAGFTALDFMRGDFGYKRNYASQTVTNRRIVMGRTAA